jgi:peptide/nickel transport system permease protein
VRRFVAVRVAQTMVVMLIVVTVVFFTVHLAPGDPFGVEAPGMTPEVQARLRQQFGYDRPLVEQYGRYLLSIARGELGFSHSLQIPVARALAATLPRTLLLMGVALTVSFALGMWLGVFETRHHGRRAARATNAFTVLVYSLPSFWLALMVLLVFAYWLPLFPAGGMRDTALSPYLGPWDSFVDRLRHLALPAASLAVWTAAYVARYQRVALLEQMPLDYVRTARAKGVDAGTVVRRHVLRNALLPMITLAGYLFPFVLGGAVLIERIYAWPGMGLLVTSAIGSRDYPLVLGAVLVGAAMVAVGNLLADIGYGLADPRVRVR